MSATGSWSLAAELHAYAIAETLYGTDVELALSPDGRRIVTMPYPTSSFDDSLQSFDLHPLVWDADSGELLHTLRHPRQAYSFAVSSDGTHIVTTAADRKVRIWGTVSGELLSTRSIDTRVDKNLPMVFSIPDLDNVVVPTLHPCGLFSDWHDDVLIVTDQGTGNIVREVYGGSWERFAFSADAKVVVEGSVEGWVRYWGAEEKQRYLLTGGPIVTCVTVSMDGSRIAAGSTNGDIQVWDAGSGDEVNAVRINDHSIDRLEISADGRIVVGALHNGPLAVWETNTRCTRELPVWNGKCCVSADGRRVVVAQPAGIISIWSESAVKEKQIWNKASQKVGEGPSLLPTPPDRDVGSVRHLMDRLKAVFRTRN